MKTVKGEINRLLSIGMPESLIISKIVKEFGTDQNSASIAVEIYKGLI